MSTQKQRPAFTLVEMLVVISIMAILAGLSVMYFPSFSERKRAGNGATMIQGWLYTAKQRAFRDGAPRGLRLFVDTTTNQVIECQFIEVPEDLFGATLKGGAVGNEKQVTVNEDLVGPDPAFSQVQVGDVLVIQDMGLPHRIVAPAPTAAAGVTTINLESKLPAPINTNAPYRIQRRPRLVGDETLKLPDDIIIDLNTNTTYANPLPATTVLQERDILFSPSGSITTLGVSTDFIALWVRDLKEPTEFSGYPALIAVWVRSGLIAGTSPAAPPATDPYQYVKAGTQAP